MSVNPVPPKDGEKKVPLNMRVSPDVQERLEKLRELRGATSLSEAATDAMVAGMEELEETAYSSENKRLINERLRAKRYGAIKALNNLEALARHFGESPHERDVRHAPELLSIASEFKTWLSE